VHCRTARAGVTGKITSLLQKRDKVLASRIEDAILHGRPLDELSGERGDLPPNMRYVTCLVLVLNSACRCIPDTTSYPLSQGRLR
jgi:hypothetical protein